ncbi:MAG: Lrp/AsnC family transcriptional regulator [Flavobacteriales bacterium]|jgi:DNA-binding Lrp family transcriptional regulator|nr:Lrp/AsnC family transcriptional regulator [Flavobacteriales bacterium]MBT3677559.1 Lrp/AsnC family transcriptional regulator [Flavobacteriales bacterium]MBT3739563.1 Lrp/AsnC family transcriptional regulator [Flavobacteriales bacterium]MBT4102147.1 Lrp/AsnC family transcriptional regulator [Flavobacteriales bacterium]MBT4202619.1 Lrp/AsnC family transcriptional regulator [Flavobacteriales bacterium]
MSKKEKITEPVNVALLEALAKNARTPVKELAVMVGKSATATYERIQKLEATGAIQGYHARVSDWAIGKPLTVFASVRLKEHFKETIDGFVRDISRIEEVEEWFHITGQHDFMLRVNMSGIQDYQHFLTEKLASLPNIATVQSLMVLKHAHGVHLT